MNTLYVRPGGDRPDFRIVLTFLWSEDRDLDTDGDSDNPASRSWTELYAQDRRTPEETVDCSPVSKAPLILKIESEKEYLAARLAWFLTSETDGTVSTTLDGPYQSAETIKDKLGEEFDLSAAVERARACRYNKATLDNPYPK